MVKTNFVGRTFLPDGHIGGTIHTHLERFAHKQIYQWINKTIRHGYPVTNTKNQARCVRVQMLIHLRKILQKKEQVRRKPANAEHHHDEYEHFDNL